MNISNNTSLNFKSLNNPVKPFKVQTSEGEISFKEINYNKKPRKPLLKEVSTFFLDNFAATSSHPYWEKCRKGGEQFDEDEYDFFIECDMDNYKKTLENPDTTVLLGRDKGHKLVSAVFAHPLEETPIINDDNTLYIDSIAVDKKYRGNNVGKKVLENVIESTKNRYTDTFLVAYNESVPFYEKDGFKKLDSNDKNQKAVIENLAETRKDFPQYASFMTKPIDEIQSRWYDRL